MGCSGSQLATSKSDCPIFMVSFADEQVHVYNAEPTIVEMIRNNLKNHYTPGINKEGKIDDAVIFHLFGLPFENKPGKDHKCMLSCMCNMLKDISAAGYIKLLSGDLNSIIDLEAWFFYKSPQPVMKDVQFCVIDLWGDEKLKLCNLDKETCEEIKYVVYENWRGIMKAGQKNDAYSLTMAGKPWADPFGEDGVKNRTLIMKILQKMGSYGWTLYSASNVDGDTDTLFMSRVNGMYISSAFSESMIAISLGKSDRIRLINCGDDVREMLKTVIDMKWSKIQNETEIHGSYEFELKGKPWWAPRESALPSIALLCSIFTALRYVGWKSIANLDISTTDNDKGVFFFVKMPPKTTHYCALSLKGSNLLYGVGLKEDILAALQVVIGDFIKKLLLW